MITIFPTKDIGLITKVIIEPTLWKVMYGQGHEKCDFKPNMTFTYLLILDNNKDIIGLFQIRELTKMLLECHSFILPQYWGTTKSKEAVKAGFDWVRQNTQYLKCFTDIPEDCVEVKKASEIMGWTKIGTVQNGIIYNNRLQSIDFYEYALRG